MSSFHDAGARQAETQAQTEKGASTFLSQDERAQVARLLGHPEDFPPEFKDWLLDYFAVNIPQIPIGQIAGFSQYKAVVGTRVDGQGSTTSSSYVELDGGHPQITGLGAGDYLLFHGAAIESTGATKVARQTLKFNDENPLSDNAIMSDATDIISTSRAVTKTFVNNNNTVKCVYAVEGGAATGFFQLRWLIALKNG
jgi:hypothetical protein